MSTTRAELLISRIDSARRYTLHLLDRTDPADWFRMPPGDVTHVAWQVGHLAMAEYYLALERIRGERPEDAGLIAAGYAQAFGRTSIPSPDPSTYPPVEEIRATFDRVHAQALKELKALTDADLDAPTATPHPMFTTKQGALLWCSEHEFLHAGQIGLLRRLLGQAQLW